MTHSSELIFVHQNRPVTAEPFKLTASELADNPCFSHAALITYATLEPEGARYQHFQRSRTVLSPMALFDLLWERGYSTAYSLYITPNEPVLRTLAWDEAFMSHDGHEVLLDWTRAGEDNGDAWRDVLVSLPGQTLSEFLPPLRTYMKSKEADGYCLQWMSMHPYKELQWDEEGEEWRPRATYHVHPVSPTSRHTARLATSQTTGDVVQVIDVQELLRQDREDLLTFFRRTLAVMQESPTPMLLTIYPDNSFESREMVPLKNVRDYSYRVQVEWREPVGSYSYRTTKETYEVLIPTHDDSCQGLVDLYHHLQVRAEHATLSRLSIQPEEKF